MRKSPTCTYISQKPRKWQTPCSCNDPEWSQLSDKVKVVNYVRLVYVNKARDLSHFANHLANEPILCLYRSPQLKVVSDCSLS